MMAGFVRTLAFRLTLLYGGIFSVSSCLVFVLFYLLVARTIVQQMDQELLDKAGLFRAIYSVKGIPGVKDLSVLEARAAGEKKVFFRLLYSSGEVFATSHMDYWDNIRVDQKLIRTLLSGAPHEFETLKIQSGVQRIRVLYVMVGPGVILQTGLSMETYSFFIQAFQKVFAGAMAIVVLISAASGWLVSRKALSGVDRITETAEQITGARLDARVPVAGNQGELDRLARAFNTMLDRIQALVTSVREMSDNIAHDLKSPLTRIRGLAEITLVQAQDREEFEAMAASTIEEVDRLLDTINTMLVISRTDAGVGGFSFELLSVSDLVSEACDLFGPLAEDKGISLECSAPEPCTAVADRSMMQRACSNLLDNAIKYTDSGGRIRVSVARQSHDHLSICVEDTGIGIEPQNLDRVFDRFFRVDASRSTKGTGLGLSLAKAIARTHGGDLTVKSEPGKGSRFVLTLPIGNVGVI